ncbi:right-handed parallel beta-helix repeat-containing protein [Candidatus Hydrogenedentota bacterium]
MQHITSWLCQLALVVSALPVSAESALAETLYVDNETGNDINSGTKEDPLRTIGKAAEIVNNRAETGPTTIKIAPGIYILDKPVLFENSRAYTKDKRLVLEATILPDQPEWSPDLMPLILSTQNPPDSSQRGRDTIGLKIEVSHVTIQGLKFMGNLTHQANYTPIRRDGMNLDDLVVTQCLFTADKLVMPMHLPILAHGHGLVVDHCVFYNCQNSVVFWNAKGGSSKGNAMKYCIVYGAYTSGVWTSQTAEDFEFHHNIISSCEYFWMRGDNNKKRYRTRDCIVTNNEFYSGSGGAAKITGETGSGITFDEENITKEGTVELVADLQDIVGKNGLIKPRNHLHIVPGALGSDLGAGLFKNTKGGSNP